MHQFNFLTKLLDVEAASEPFISAYLNTEANQTGKKDFDVYLKKRFADHAAVLEEGSPKLESFEGDRQRIMEFAEGLDASTRGAAVFACSGANFFESFEFAVPFEEDRFVVSDRPHIFPLARIIDQNPTFAVVAADTNAAHIYVFQRAETIRREDIQNTKTNRTEVGGWSQMRYQRHIENFHQQHAKEVIRELEETVRNDRIDRVVLIGDQAVIIPLLRDEMSKELAGKVVDSLSLSVKTPDHEIAEAAREAIKKFDEAEDRERIEHLFDVNYDDGVGVTGVDKTLTALFNGQVQELYLNADPNEIAYRTGDIRTLLKDYAPGIDEELPEASEKEFVIDELIKQAARSADRIRFIEDPHLLKTVGGVGAILRYQAKGVSN